MGAITGNKMIDERGGNRGFDASELHHQIRDRIVQRVESVEAGDRGALILRFEDGTHLRFEYDLFHRWVFTS